MSKQQTGLGRGFDSLIPTHIIEEQYDPTSGQTQMVRKVLIQDITPNPHQPRTEFGESALRDLMDSISVHGILQPLVARPIDEKRYELIAGERRLRAAKALGHEHVPVIIRTPDEQGKLELAIIENLQRDDLNILEMATAFFKLMDQFGLPINEVGKRVGRSESSVRNIINLLNLPSEAKQALAKGKISEGHARQIIAVKEPAKQLELLELILKHGWSVRKAEQFAKTYKATDAKKHEAIAQTLEETPITKKLEKKLKAKVRIKNMSRGGRLIIEYKSQKELDRLSNLLS